MDIEENDILATKTYKHSSKHAWRLKGSDYVYRVEFIRLVFIDHEFNKIWGLADSFLQSETRIVLYPYGHRMDFGTHMESKGHEFYAKGITIGMEAFRESFEKDVAATLKIRSK